jgi:hypothetical protein
MTTNVCPACGYPTLGPALCAFCSPGEVLVGDQVFGPMPFATTGIRGANATARVGVWPGQVAI